MREWLKTLWCWMRCSFGVHNPARLSRYDTLDRGINIRYTCRVCGEVVYDSQFGGTIPAGSDQ